MKCIRHELECSFPVSDNGSPFTVAASLDGATSRGLEGQTTPSSPAPDPFHITLNITHLELLYNFITMTSFTLSSNDVIKILWQTNAVKAGFTCDYVMLSILALSALHLTRLKPDQNQSFLAQAIALHQAALSKGSPALSNITTENGESLYLFAMLTCFFALGRPREADQFLLEGDTGLAEWLVMFRGTRTVVECVDKTALQAGPLGPIFAAGSRRAQLQLSVPTQIDHLWMLQHVINDTTANRDERTVYNSAIDQLQQAFNHVYNQNTHQIESSDVFAWLYRVSEEYLLLLGQRKPEALAILAYYCVLLKKLDTIWWVNGLGDHLISQTHKVLDEFHRLWITWPMREIGWVP
jgi:hypothetical protein